VTSVPVDTLRATVLLSYADIGRQLRDRRLTVGPAGDQLRVSGSVSVLGRTISASAISTVKLSGASVVVTAKRFEVGNAAASRAVTVALGNRFDFVIRVGQLPYGLTMSSVRVRPEGVVATADAKATVLRRRRSLHVRSAQGPGTPSPPYSRRPPRRTRLASPVKSRLRPRSDARGRAR
jgi:hypothetical protein